jgi:hypothetical protein
MFAFGHPLVRPKDIVITVDVNLFLMTEKILDPIYKNPDLLAWIYQYDGSAYINTGHGESFNEVKISFPSFLICPLNSCFLIFSMLAQKIRKLTIFEKGYIACLTQKIAAINFYI